MVVKRTSRACRSGKCRYSADKEYKASKAFDKADEEYEKAKKALEAAKKKRQSAIRKTEDVRKARDTTYKRTGKKQIRTPRGTFDVVRKSELEKLIGNPIGMWFEHYDDRTGDMYKIYHGGKFNRAFAVKV